LLKSPNQSLRFGLFDLLGLGFSSRHFLRGLVYFRLWHGDYGARELLETPRGFGVSMRYWLIFGLRSLDALIN
jgi:hypothetical protein